MLNGKCRTVRKEEQGFALLVSLFMLLIISAVGLSLVLSARTESSLTGNYRGRIPAGIWESSQLGVVSVDCLEIIAFKR